MEIIMIGPITFTYEELLAKREAGVSERLLEVLRKKADAIVEAGVLDVTQRTLRAPTGNPRDYTSMGPYWWPNPDTKDGLPYVNRDCQTNPETVQPITPRKMYSNIRIVATAAFYLGDEKYSEFVDKQLYAWYIDPETSMTPNARYSQGIPGICDGRGVGLIDFSSVHHMFDALGIVECMGKISKATADGVRAWYNKFLDWMLTHEQGYQANIAINNHGAWFDAHVLTAAVALDRRALAKKICDTSYDIRHRRHIMDDGSQPHELRRVSGIGYSLMNLDALTVIANIADRLGYKQYWSVDEKRGKCLLRSAVDYLYPIIKERANLPDNDPKKSKGSVAFSRLLVMMNERFPGEGYAERLMEFDNLGEDVETLLPFE